MASGRPIIAKVYYTCKSCRHKMIESEIDRAGLKHCALCHVPIVETKK
jgi:WD repeat-containing protein 35